MSTPAPDILALTSREYVDHARAGGRSAVDALADYRRVFRDHGLDAPCVTRGRLPVATTSREHDTVKFTQRMRDGLETESVILPIRSRTGRLRYALCVSSQIGCALGCTFCETAQMGLLRNLDAGEIIAQWHAARFHFGAPISNLVYMGMGEPMDNLEAVMQSIRVATDHNGPSVAPSRITVSTVGRIDGMRRLAEFARTPGRRGLNLAVSVNAPNDEIRSRLMPINRAAPMAALLDAMLAWPTGRRARVLVEYVVIPGVNDRLQHADELASYLRPLACTVNVIPYNPRRDSPWPAPEEGSVERFTARLQARGVLARRRLTLGRSIMGACGQLGSAAVRRRRHVPLVTPATT